MGRKNLKNKKRFLYPVLLGFGFALIEILVGLAIGLPRRSNLYTKPGKERGFLVTLCCCSTGGMNAWNSEYTGHQTTPPESPERILILFVCFAGDGFSLFMCTETFMEKKQTSCHPVQKTDKCTLESIKEPKKKCNPKNNWPKPESRPFETLTIIQNLHILSVIQGSCTIIAGGWIVWHVYLNSTSYIFIFLFKFIKLNQLL